MANAAENWTPPDFNRKKDREWKALGMLRKATFELNLDDAHWGTAFFFSPELALTADHNLRPRHPQTSFTGFFAVGEKVHELELQWLPEWSSEEADIAVLRLIKAPEGFAVVASASDGGEICLWKVSTGRLVAAHVTRSTEDWITYVPEGYFIGSEGILENVMAGFRRDGAQFDCPAWFFSDNPNPDKVETALAEAFGRTRGPAATAPKAYQVSPAKVLGSLPAPEEPAPGEK